ncbi:SPT3 Dosage dependent suppressor of Ty-induced promoter mutations-like protein [Entophlyctis luteolus]|nr:SPT3 Dosage dependent suppressor of Ty-induced promoter mutations-like protein [Entophlyctis luteolus]
MPSNALSTMQSILRSRAFPNSAIPSATSQPIQHHQQPSFNVDTLKLQMDAAFAFSGSFSLRILGVPATNARSRVETQTKLCLQMVNQAGTKTSAWTHLRLPELLVTKEKTRKSQNVVDYSLIPINKVLDLQAIVVCASDPKKDVQICNGCQLREAKRGGKKKSLEHDTGNDMKIEELSSNLNGGTSNGSDSAKIVLFNCGSYVDFSSGDTILPTRITCYCRHHNEKIGFCIYFIARDHNSKIVATGISPPILVTDDHKGTKTSKGSASQKRPRAAVVAALQNQVEDPIDAIMNETTPTSPPNTILRTQADYADDAIAQFIPNLLSSESTAPLFENFGIKPAQSDVHRPKKKVANSSMPASSLSPPDMSIPPAIHSLLANQTPYVPPPAIINRLIPGEGPIQGGVEVTVLGENLSNGMIVVFGDMEAITTQVWGASTMICILPPSSSPGPVPVSLRMVAGFVANFPDIPVTFMYKDDLDRSLMELALQIMGLRMTGSLDSARNIAMKIVNDTAQETLNDAVLSFTELSRNDLEVAVLNALFALEESENEIVLRSDLDLLEYSSPHVVLTSLLDMTFHTPTGLNIMHIAACSGMTTLLKYLVSLDCDLDPRDKNGYTPLMHAIHVGNMDIVRILLQAGSSHLLTSTNGLSCYALARLRGLDAFNEFLDTLDELAPVDGCWDLLIKSVGGLPMADSSATAHPIVGSDALDANLNQGVPEVLKDEVHAAITNAPLSFNDRKIPDISDIFSRSTDLDKELLSATGPKDILGNEKKKGAAIANTRLRWSNPEEEIQNIMNAFKMYSFLGPLAATLVSARPLIVNNVDMASTFVDAHTALSEFIQEKQLPRVEDGKISASPFSGYIESEDHLCDCEAWNNGLGTHHADCRQARQERKRQRRKVGGGFCGESWIGWVSVGIVFATSIWLLGVFAGVWGDMRDLDCVLEWAAVGYDRALGGFADAFSGLRREGASMVLEFLNNGFAFED